MSQSLSQQLRLYKAAKDLGSCSVCGKTSAVKAGDGSIHQHGHRNAPCPGSNKPPATIAAAHFLHTNDDPVPSDLQPANPMPPSVTTKTLRLDHPVTIRPLVKSIPRSARQACSTLLAGLIAETVDKPAPRHGEIFQVAVQPF